MINQKGFTLFEIMTCLIIISTLTAISAPSVYSIKKLALYRTEVNFLVRSFQQAKMIAIKSNCYVVFKMQPNGYSIFVDGGAGGGVAGDWLQQGDEKIIINRKVPTNIHMVTTFSAGRTRFSGRLGVKPGRVTVTDDLGRKSDVVISLIGRIRVQKT